MTWSERIKLAWTTFKREALPLYAWTLIFIGLGAILVVAMVMGVLGQMHWTFPQAFGEFSSPGMPVPGVPPTPDTTPFKGPFGFNQGPFDSFGGPFSNFPMLISAIGAIAGSLLLIVLVGWLIGSAFYTGLFNLTAKAYHGKVTFKDFRFKGIFRVFGWQGLLLLIELILIVIGSIGAFSLRHSQGVLVAFMIVYGLIIVGISIYVLPWISSSAIYLLAHPQAKFREALNGSWRFFQKHMGALWGYIGTVILIEIGVQVLSRISSGIAGLATLVVSPFIAVLAIVWVLSLEEDEHLNDVAPLVTSPYYPTQSSPAAQPTSETPPIPDSFDDTNPSSEYLTPDTPISESDGPKIDLQKQRQEFMTPLPEDKPNYCPSCGKANTGTTYCPQCGTKL